MKENKKVRLDRFLSNSHVGTRSEVKKYIKENRIKVNNLVINNPSYHVNLTDIITIDGKIVQPHRNVYIKLHKPSGFVSTTSEHEPSVLSLINHPYVSELHIAGRLDKDVEGLLILTNDGEFTHNLITPKKHIEKEYYIYFPTPVTVDKKMKEKVKTGINLENFKTMPGDIEQIDEKIVSITIVEGKYHQIKLMCKALNLTNWERIVRVRIGNLVLGDLQKGDWEELEEKEIKEKIFIH